MTAKKTCATCKNRAICVGYYFAVELYTQLDVEEMADRKQLNKWLKDTLERLGKICRFYEEE